MANLAKHHKSRTNVQRISPFIGIHRAVNEAMKDFYSMFETPTGAIGQLNTSSMFPAMDVIDTGNQFKMELEMPGMDENDISISLNDNILTIRGKKTTSKETKDKNYLNREIRYGSYERSIEIPTTANGDKAFASFNNGVLSITIPKKAEHHKQPKKIKISKQAEKSKSKTKKIK